MPQKSANEELNDNQTSPERRVVLMEAANMAGNFGQYCLDNNVGPFSCEVDQIGSVIWSGDRTKRS